MVHAVLRHAPGGKAEREGDIVNFLDRNMQTEGDQRGEPLNRQGPGQG